MEQVQKNPLHRIGKKDSLVELTFEQTGHPFVSSKTQNRKTEKRYGPLTISFFL